MRSENLVVNVLLELQFLLQGLQAVLGIHSPQHLILQLPLGITIVDVQLGGRTEEEGGGRGEQRCSLTEAYRREIKHSSWCDQRQEIFFWEKSCSSSDRPVGGASSQRDLRQSSGKTH